MYLVYTIGGIWKKKKREKERALIIMYECRKEKKNRLREPRVCYVW